MPFHYANAVPIVHFSTALLILWYARKLPFDRWLGGVYLLLTAAATMGFGEHYFFDLVVAVPYAVIVYALGSYVAKLELSKILSMRSRYGLSPVSEG